MSQTFANPSRIGRAITSSTRCLAGYTIGLGLTESQAATLNGAMQAFQAALGREV